MRRRCHTAERGLFGGPSLVAARQGIPDVTVRTFAGRTSSQHRAAPAEQAGHRESFGLTAAAGATPTSSPFGAPGGVGLLGIRRDTAHVSQDAGGI